MTREKIIKLLRTSGNNTKGEVLKFFESPTKQGLLELIKDLQEELRKMEAE